MLIAAPLAMLLFATGLFYLIERRAGAARRNVALLVWVALGLAGLAWCVIRIQLSAPTASGFDQIAEFIFAAAAGVFTLAGLAGAGLAWLARKALG